MHGQKNMKLFINFKDQAGYSVPTQTEIFLEIFLP
jgi:hypothetical protein